MKKRLTNRPAIHMEGDRHKVFHNLSFDNVCREICLPVHDLSINAYTITRNNATGPDGIGIARVATGDDPPGIADHNWEGDIRLQVMAFGDRDFR